MTVTCTHLQILAGLSMTGGIMTAKLYALPTPLAKAQQSATIVAMPRRTKHGLQEVLPFEWPTTQGANAIALVAPRVTPGANDTFDQQVTSSSDLPPAQQWATRLVHGVVEVINGVRPATQLTRWITPEVMTQVQSRIMMKNMPRFNIRSIHVTQTDDGVAEVCSVFGTVNRSFAMAMRLEGLDGRWKATSLMWAL